VLIFLVCFREASASTSKAGASQSFFFL